MSGNRYNTMSSRRDVKISAVRKLPPYPTRQLIILGMCLVFGVGCRITY